MNFGEKFKTHCYKHDGSIHKCWEENFYLGSTEEYNIFTNYRTKVVEFDGRVWYTKEPAIIFFSKKNWFHIIGQLKNDGTYYYCDIASPHVIEDKTIKYIDYDLDLRVYPNGSFRVLDREEYNYHKMIMGYSNELDKILRDNLTELINRVRNREFPFNDEVIKKYYEEIKKIINIKVK